MTHIRRKFVEAERACLQKLWNTLACSIPKRKTCDSGRPRTKKCQKPERRRDCQS
ncbi:MAG: hypothetical protein ACOCOD_03075, partial [Prevotella sp.]